MMAGASGAAAKSSSALISRPRRAGLFSGGRGRPACAVPPWRSMHRHTHVATLGPDDRLSPGPPRVATAINAELARQSPP
jgi:hypothetical protein